MASPSKDRAPPRLENTAFPPFTLLDPSASITKLPTATNRQQSLHQQQQPKHGISSQNDLSTSFPSSNPNHVPLAATTSSISTLPSSSSSTQPLQKRVPPLSDPSLSSQPPQYYDATAPLSLPLSLSSPSPDDARLYAELDAVVAAGVGVGFDDDPAAAGTSSEYTILPPLVDSDGAEFPLDGDAGIAPHHSLESLGLLSSTSSGPGASFPFAQHSGYLTASTLSSHNVSHTVKGRWPPARPTAEAGLSARSFSEKNLVAVRDSVIKVTEEQVRMLSLQNAQLRRAMNEVESEMITLQEALSAKDKMIIRKDRDIEGMEREMASLMSENQKGAGRENAMNLASKQNTALLRLLEQEEKKSQERLDEVDTLNMQLGVVRAAHEKLTRESAENEAVLKERIKTVRQKANEKTREAELNQTKSMELQANLMELQNKTKVEGDAMKEELFNRRDKVYQLLEKLQSTEDKLRIKVDECEALAERAEAGEERNGELELRLKSIREDLAEREEQLAVKEARLKEQEVESENKMKALVEHNAELETKVTDLSSTVMQLVERHKITVEKRRVEEASFNTMTMELDLVREREQRLLESLSGKNRQFIQLEADHKDAQREIQRLVAELDDVRNGGAEGGLDLLSQEELSATTLPMAASGNNYKHMNKSKLLELEATARRRLFENFLFSICQQVIVSDALQDRCIVEAKQSLVLNDCSIDDIDVITLVSVMKSSRTITELHLVSNRITDAGAAALAGYIALSNCKLSFVDLRNNAISMSGVKRIAEALQANKGRQIEHVYVHNDGKIDAIGTKLGGGVSGGGGESDLQQADLAASSSASTLAKIRSAMSSICVVDARENFPDMASYLPVPVGTSSTIWSKINEALPDDNTLKLKALKKKALMERKKNASIRDEMAANVYS